MSIEFSDPWTEFVWEYPGVTKPSDGAIFAEVVRAGTSPGQVIAQAKAYRRLIDAQDELPAPAGLWLAALLGDDIADDGPSETEAFSAATRALRAVQGWSQVQLASLAGISPNTLHKVEEAGETRRPTRLAVAEALGWTVDEMVDLGCTVLAR